MDPARRQRIEDVFDAALDRVAGERAAFVAAACGDDLALRQEVEGLVAHAQVASEFLAGPIRAVAAEVLGASTHLPPETTDSSHEPQTAFAAGDLVCDRFRIVRLLGKGGMGEVYQAEDLVLSHQHVALKTLPRITASEERAAHRLKREIALARHITHPNVCRVFDVYQHRTGSGAFITFFTMELIEGDTLAERLRSCGTLTTTEALPLVRQMAAALGAAHVAGIVHGDLKPANMMLVRSTDTSETERLVVTDFGLAHYVQLATNASTMTASPGVGTPAYMAPEQIAGAGSTPQTDIFALGVVIQEMIGGSPVHPRIPVDPRWHAVIGKCLHRDAAARFTTTEELVNALEAPVVKTWQRWRAIAAVVALIGVAALAASLAARGNPFMSFFSTARPALTDQDTLVLADFENTSGEAVFDGALQVGLAVALEQSPFLKVFPDNRVRETLRLMQRPADAPVTRALAREVAQRERLSALIAGSITSLGSHYVLALEAINAETGDVMAREQIEAGSKEEVLTSLGNAASRLRAKLGESLSSIEKFDVPLPRATTTSLEALQSYSLALDQGRVIPRLEAVPYLKRAIELDPDFALAQAALSGVYRNTNQTAQAPPFSRRAFELRDRVSERERFFISWRYYVDAAQDWDKALELSRSWAATYPREALAFNSVGAASLITGQFEQAVSALREAVRMDPKFAPAYSNLAAALLALDRVAEAKAVLQQAVDQKLTFDGATRLTYLVAFVQGDTKTMASALESSVGVGATNTAFGWQAQSSAFAGRVQTAHEQYRRGIQRALQGSFHQVAAQLAVQDAELHAIVGQCAEARSELPPGLGVSLDSFILAVASRVFALCGTASEATRLSREVARQFPEATLTVRIQIPVTAAALALMRGEPSRALEILEPVQPYDHAPSAEFWPAYLRGQAYLQLKDGRAAASQFRTIVDHRGEVPASVKYALSHLGLARAAMLEGDTDTARKAYDSFFALWSAADPTLQPLEEARAEYLRLRE
jgi:serine/threonine protein kinase/Tfp pilus assembly protein PilF